MKYSEVLKVLREVKHLSHIKATDIDFKRTYIAKADGGVRPLGVPTLAWRIYLHMVNNLIVEWRLVTEGNSQHGYLPKRGVITA
jgi:RNA-directed DNA polymerase